MKSSLQPPVPQSGGYVGGGLQERTYEACLYYGVNPNPNPPGQIRLPTDPQVMRKFIEEEQAYVIRGLRRD